MTKKEALEILKYYAEHDDEIYTGYPTQHNAIAIACQCIEKCIEEDIEEDKDHCTDCDNMVCMADSKCVYSRRLE